MAPWQVVFSIVPRRAFSAAAIAAPSGNLDSPIGVSWGREALRSDYAQHLGAVASPVSSGAGEPSSSDELQAWGPEDGNRVEVRSVNGHVTTITARVDVRKLDSRFGAMLLHFVRIANAVLVRSDGLIVEPIVGAFSAALKNSDAWRFANDPLKDLKAYSDLESDDE